MPIPQAIGEDHHHLHHHHHHNPQHHHHLHHHYHPSSSFSSFLLGASYDASTSFPPPSPTLLVLQEAFAAAVAAAAASNSVNLTGEEKNGYHHQHHQHYDYDHSNSHQHQFQQQTQQQQGDQEEVLLRAINDHKARLLLPAILLTMVLMLMGVLGNPLAIYIYGWRWQTSSTKVFLFALAVVDLLNCLITIPTELLSMRHYYDFPSDGLCKASRFTTYALNNATVVIFLSIAVDRYLRICHPHRRAVSARGAKAACGVGLLLGLGVSWPALLLYGRIEMKVPAAAPTATAAPTRRAVDAERPVFVTGAMCLVHGSMERYSLAFFVYLCSAFFVCTLILVILYTLIGRAILRRKRLMRRRKEVMAATLETLGGAANAAEEAVTMRNGNTAPGWGRSVLDLPEDSAASTPRVVRRGSYDVSVASSTPCMARQEKSAIPIASSTPCMARQEKSAFPIVSSTSCMVKQEKSAVPGCAPSMQCTLRQEKSDIASNPWEKSAVPSSASSTPCIARREQSDVPVNRSPSTARTLRREKSDIPSSKLSTPHTARREKSDIPNASSTPYMARLEKSAVPSASSTPCIVRREKSDIPGNQWKKSDIPDSASSTPCIPRREKHDGVVPGNQWEKSEGVVPGNQWEKSDIPGNTSSTPCIPRREKSAVPSNALSMPHTWEKSAVPSASSTPCIPRREKSDGVVPSNQWEKSDGVVPGNQWEKSDIPGNTSSMPCIPRREKSDRVVPGNQWEKSDGVVSGNQWEKSNIPRRASSTSCIPRRETSDGVVPGSRGPSTPLRPSPPQRRDTREEEQGCHMQNFSVRCRKLRPPRATLMLFLITVVFVISFLPFLIISIIRQDRGSAFYLGLSSREQVIVNIFIRSYIVNNCTNPIVYGICNSQFRQECRRLYLLCRRRGGGGGAWGGEGATNSPPLHQRSNRTVLETPQVERKVGPEVP